MKFLKIVFRKFFKLHIWRIGLSKMTGSDLNQTSTLLDNDNFIYAADPFSLDEESILFEGITWKKSIGKIYLFKQNKIREISFPDNFKKFHMSYPYSFIKKDKSYIIPQISNFNSLVSFSLDINKLKASFHLELLKGVQCRDSILFNYNEYDFIFSTVLDSNSNKIFKVYRSVQNNYNFEEYDFSGLKNNARCAGKLIEKNNELYLPIQNDKPIYGSGISIYKISFKKDKINFDFEKSLNLKSEKIKYTGFHTISNYKNKYLIDFRYSKYYPLAFYNKFKILRNNFVRKIQFLNIPRYFYLKIFYNIEKWHLKSLLAYPRYYDVVNNINKKYNFSSVNEIGCGLSEMNRYIKFNDYQGFDIDKKVINLPLFLKGGNISYIDNFKKSANCTIVINFLHNLSLRKVLQLYNKINESKFIMVDEINKHSIGYKYKHNYCDIFSQHKLILINDVFNGKRRILLYEK